MSVFRRRRREDDAAEGSPEGGAPADAAEQGADAGDPDEGPEASRGLSARPEGPWDSAERPETEGYVDLGGLRLAGRDGMELRLEIDEASGAVNGVAVVLGGSAVLLHAYAAPRSEGIWDDIRTEIATGVTRQGGTADELPGPFGRELLVRVPVRSSDGRTGHQAQRFVGVDGPRWFLRAVFQGPAAHDEAAAAELEAVVRDVVVVRGAEAMAPREVLPLRLPEAVQEAAEAAEEQSQERPPLDPFRRGPEITEIR
ncbi:MAG TPA: DUF3710 domain-containing protein [Kineosporiaceae bacterium]|nr:DUF3710 domain-containing protein [Kineosporiaceae bacterium]